MHQALWNARLLLLAITCLAQVKARTKSVAKERTVMKAHRPARHALLAICAWPVQLLPPTTHVRLVVTVPLQERTLLVPRELTVLSAPVPANRKHVLRAILGTIAHPREW